MSKTRLLWLVPLVLLLSACGLNLAGEPDIKSENEMDLDSMRQSAAQTTPVDSSQPNYDLGMQVYLAQCATCHGAQDGTGPGLGTIQDNAATRVEGQSADAYMHESIVNPSAYIVPGYDDVMPKNFGDTLSNVEMDSVVLFMQQFTPPGQQPRPTAAPQATATTEEAVAAAPVEGTPAQAATPAASVVPDLPTIDLTPAPTPSGDIFTVRGSVIQGTSGGPAIPPGLALQLYIIDQRQQDASALVGTYDATTDDSGQFAFENVARNVHYEYIIQADYGGVVQGAHIPGITGTESEVNTDVTIYETTTDASSVMIMWAQTLFNYAPIDEFGLEVRLDVVVMNTGDKIVISDEIGQNGWPITAKIELPAETFGIQPLQSASSQRYETELVNSIPVVKDTWPIRPKQEHDITILYYLPYSSDAVIDTAFNYPVIGGAVLLPNDRSVKFESDQFTTEGEFRYRAEEGGLSVVALELGEKISPKTDASLVKEYDLINPLEANERMLFTLSGKPSGVQGSGGEFCD